MDLEEEKVEVNLKKFKGHHRRFPWGLIVRVIVALALIIMIFWLMNYLNEIKEKSIPENAIEIEF